MTVTDSGGLADTATLTISVTDLNEAPSAVAQIFNINDGTSAVGRFVAEDVDAGDSVSFTIDGTALAIDNEGRITVAEPAQFAYGRRTSATVTVTDRDGLSVSVMVHVDVNFVLEIGPGWNHVSLPVDPVANTVEEVFAEAPIIGRVLRFEGLGFARATVAESETGYWFYATRAAHIVVPGTLADNIVDFNARWSAFGAATEVQSPSRFSEIVAVIRFDVPTQRFRFVWPSATLRPGQGYWAYARNAATLDLTAAAARSSLTLIGSEDSRGQEFDEMLSSFAPER